MVIKYKTKLLFLKLRKNLFRKSYFKVFNIEKINYTLNQLLICTTTLIYRLKLEFLIVSVYMR